MRWLVLFAVMLVPALAAAQSTIRDDETEAYLRTLANPVFEAAGLSKDSIQLFIVNDPGINAFVTGGQNMFLNTGLITRYEDPLVLTGVIAHEAGHIAGGHLIGKKAEAKQSAIQALGGTLLGIASVLAGADGSVGVAVSAASQNAALRNFLSYSRAHEQAADQAALNYLDQLALSPTGLAKLLDDLDKEMRLHGERPDPYLVTHPLSPARVSHIKAHMAQKAEAGGNLPPRVRGWHDRVVAKLKAFLEPPKKTLASYTDDSIPARLARAVAYHRKPDLDAALKEIDALISDFANDPYLHELRGQILFEHGEVAASVESYTAAHEMLPNAPMILLGLAIAHIAADGEGDLAKASGYLRRALTIEPKNPELWRQLAIAEGRQDRLGASYLAQAEYSLLRGEKDEAKQYLDLAKRHAGPERQLQRQMDDLSFALDQAEEK